MLKNDLDTNIPILSIDKITKLKMLNVLFISNIEVKLNTIKTHFSL